MPDATAAAIVNSREDWPQQKITVGLSSASLSRAAGSPWQRGPGSFRGNTEGGGGGPSGDACSTQLRTWLRYPAADRTVVTDLMWWPRILHGKDRAARRDPLSRIGCFPGAKVGTDFPVQLLIISEADGERRLRVRLGVERLGERCVIPGVEQFPATAAGNRDESISGGGGAAVHGVHGDGSCRE